MYGSGRMPGQLRRDVVGGGFQEVFARRYDWSNERRLGPEFQCQHVHDRYQYNGAMAVNSSGNLVVVWGDAA
jgi:hypothetical protein